MAELVYRNIQIDFEWNDKIKEIHSKYHSVNKRDPLGFLEAKGIAHNEAESKKKRGLDKPMDVNERARRKRIRDKSMSGIHDLVLADLSGIIPSKKDIENDNTTLDLMINNHMMILIFLIYISKDKNDKEIKRFFSDFEYKKNLEHIKSLTKLMEDHEKESKDYKKKLEDYEKKLEDITND